MSREYKKLGGYLRGTQAYTVRNILVFTAITWALGFGTFYIYRFPGGDPIMQHFRELDGEEKRRRDQIMTLERLRQLRDARERHDSRGSGN